MNPQPVITKPLSSTSAKHTLSSHEQAYSMDLGGIIALLSQHLYAQGIDVVVRELLQNAVDALTERRLGEPGHAGSIEIECSSPDDSGGLTLSVSDDGAGISPEEITKALGTIGFSLKRAGNDPDHGPFIGRFGVGLLSGFMAADEIHVLSRKADGTSPPFRWIGHSSGKWEAHPLEEDLSPGTRVFLQLQPDKARQLPPEKVRDLARRFGEYLPGRILFRSGEKEEELNRPPFWEGAADEETLLRLGKEVFKTRFLGAFRFSCDEARAEGIAFLTPQATARGQEPRHRLYVRRMLVGDQVRGLAPDEAPFLQCLVNADSLKVNAAREDLHGEETRREDLRKALRDAFDDYLRRARKSAKNQVRNIFLTHHECLLSSAESNELHLKLLTETVPLRTTMGEQTASKILRRHGELSYVSGERDYLRLELKAAEEGQCVARASDLISNRLLSLLSRRDKKGRVTEISAAEFLARFQCNQVELGAAESNLLALLQKELQPDGCRGDFEDGEDPFSPATLHLDDEESIFRHLGGDDWEDEADLDDQAHKQLVLNRSHPVVERILETRDLPEEQARAWIRVFFHHALLAARERPTAAESRRHSRALTSLWNAGLSL